MASRPSSEQLESTDTWRWHNLAHYASCRISARRRATCSIHACKDGSTAVKQGLTAGSKYHANASVKVSAKKSSHCTSGTAGRQGDAPAGWARGRRARAARAAPARACSPLATARRARGAPKTTRPRCGLSRCLRGGPRSRWSPATRFGLGSGHKRSHPLLWSW